MLILWSTRVKEVAVCCGATRTTDVVGVAGVSDAVLNPIDARVFTSGSKNALTAVSTGIAGPAFGNELGVTCKIDPKSGVTRCLTSSRVMVGMAVIIEPVVAGRAM